MLASALNSDQAIQVNIQIVRIFNKMREMMITHKDLLLEIELIKNQVSNHEDRILLIFDYLKQFEKSKQEEFQQCNRPQIGFKSTLKEEE
jgi:hypothetical protein